MVSVVSLWKYRNSESSFITIFISTFFSLPFFVVKHVVLFLLFVFLVYIGLYLIEFGICPCMICTPEMRNFIRDVNKKIIKGLVLIGIGYVLFKMGIAIFSLALSLFNSTFGIRQ